MNGLHFRISAKSFFQTNTDQAARLFNCAMDFAALKPDDGVLDLYCGSGSITLHAARLSRQVVGMEQVEDSVSDAMRNATLNGITNTTFVTADLNKGFVNQLPFIPDVILADPPRAGLSAAVVSDLLKLVPKRIVYVSCNVATQARDLQMLQPALRIVKSKSFDMFPQTHHVENIVLLEKRSGE
jgi:23S rRNA (uracil1939-C5)-methyltransferase